MTQAGKCKIFALKKILEIALGTSLASLFFTALKRSSQAVTDRMYDCPAPGYIFSAYLL